MAGGVAPAPEAQSWPPALGARRSALGARRSALGARRYYNINNVDNVQHTAHNIKLIAKPPGPRVNATGALNAPLLARSLSCSVNIK